METIDLCKIKEICEDYYSIRLRIMKNIICIYRFNDILSVAMPQQLREILSKIKYSYFEIVEKYDLTEYVNSYTYENSLKNVWKLNSIKSDLYSDRSDYVRLITLEEAIYGIYDIIINGE